MRHRRPSPLRNRPNDLRGATVWISEHEGGTTWISSRAQRGAIVRHSMSWSTSISAISIGSPSSSPDRTGPMT
jgi:hypothetical protein